DPFKNELLTKRHLLLTGADWFSRFSTQASFEMLSFFMLALPLLIDVGEWYTGHLGHYLSLPNIRCKSLASACARGWWIPEREPGSRRAYPLELRYGRGCSL